MRFEQVTAPFPAQNCDLFRTVRFFVGLFGIEFGIASGMNGVDRISKKYLFGVVIT